MAVFRPGPSDPDLVRVRILDNGYGIEGITDMKAIAVALVAGLTLTAGAASAAAEGLYVGGAFGYGGNSDATVDSGTVIGGFVGTHFGNHGRIEAELAYRQNDLAVLGIPVSGEVTSLALMGNAFYDFGDGSGFTPYLGIGMGFASVTLDSAFYNTDDTGTAVAVQAMAGAAIPFTESLSLTVEGRAFGTVGPSLEDNFGNEAIVTGYYTYAAMLGLRKRF